MPKVEKEIPWCTVILVVSTLTCHYLVLQGNLSTSAAMQNMGASTGGWSRVGLGLARSLRDELDILMTNVTAMLTDAINQTVGVQEYIDVVVSMVGNVTDGAADKAKKEAEAALLQISQEPGKPSDTMATAKKLGETITSGVNGVIGNLISMLTTKLGEFLEAIKPALYKCGEWLLKFGDQIQQVLESFSITLDKVQKIFDQIMSELSGGPPEEVVDKMLYDTFSLFDVSKSGAVTLQDLEDIGEMYSIESLGGNKAKDLLTKYDQNKDKKLDKKEYKLFVDDPDIPGSMSVVLRKYAKKMSNIAGVIAQAKMRDEMSLAVVNFMQLVCSKNRTKMSWVAQMLTNATLPVEFTAAILSQLAVEKDNPDLLTKDDIGDLVISEMLYIDFNGTMKAYDRMMNITWWSEEGFDPLDFAIMTQRVTDWIVGAATTKELLGDDIKIEPGKKGKTADRIILSQTEVFEHFSSSAYALGKQHLDDHCRARQEKRARKRNELFKSESQQFMFHHLLGGVMASEKGGGGSSAAEQAVNSGQPCKPVTLEFAKWLAWNCTDQVAVFIKQTFDYSSDSSSPLDSFATNIQALVKKIQSFLNMIEKYATPAGIDKLSDQIMNFTGKAANDIAKLVNKKLSGIIDKSMGILNTTLTTGLEGASKALSNTVAAAITGPLGGAITAPLQKMIGDQIDDEAAGEKLGGMLGDALQKKLVNLTSTIISDKMQDVIKNLIDQALDAAGKAVDQVSEKFGGKSLIEEHAMINSQHQLSAEALAQLHADIELQADMSGVWSTIVTVLQALSDFLPQSTKILKFARKEVSEAAKGMDGVFKTFEVKGPAIFDTVSALWSTVWVLYFFLVAPISLGLLFYGFWASGYCGGPKAIEYEADVPGPKTFMERCYACCSACNMCLKGYHDTALCFWSFIIFAQVVCLLLFIISLLICILAGVNAFVVAGCSQVYMLADPKVCGQTLQIMVAFLDTFHVNIPGEMLEAVCGQEQLLTCQLIEAKMKKAMVYTTTFSFLAAILSFQMLIESALLHERARWRRILDALDKEEIES
mmetsp:Transcript_130732/g.212844  ORF Transcript_130732/g.212844 Transcript_130732/m.212844 type:complete len:1046 (-) Transcript_130732:133-3270(-)